METLMETLAEQPSNQQKLAESLRSYDDVVTQFSEIIDGVMRTTFELNFDGHELYGHDGRAMGQVVNKALDDAHNLARCKPNLHFEYRRRWQEREEYTELIKMARGELSAADGSAANTMVVVSDFPAELMVASEDLGGYNVQRKQTMLRVLSRQPDGRIKMISQSLDRSDRRALEAIYHELGFIPEDGELLGQRLHLQLSPEAQAFLVDRLTGVYDSALVAQDGGQWYAGRRPIDHSNTYDFARSQHDLIEAYMLMQRNKMLDEQTMYNLAATMQKRFEKATVHQTYIVLQFNANNQAELMAEIYAEGNSARLASRSFSACGGTLAPGGLEVSTEDRLDKAGYGNKTEEKTDYKFDRKTFCVVCQPKPKKGDIQKMCGPCGICHSCDRKLGGKG